MSDDLRARLRRLAQDLERRADHHAEAADEQDEIGVAVFTEADMHRREAEICRNLADDVRALYIKSGDARA